MDRGNFEWLKFIWILKFKLQKIPAPQIGEVFHFWKLGKLDKKKHWYTIVVDISALFSPPPPPPLPVPINFFFFTIFYQHVTYQPLSMLKLNCYITQQNFWIADLHFAKSE